MLDAILTHPASKDSSPYQLLPTGRPLHLCPAGEAQPSFTPHSQGLRGGCQKQGQQHCLPEREGFKAQHRQYSISSQAPLPKTNGRENRPARGEFCSSNPRAVPLRCPPGEVKVWAEWQDIDDRKVRRQAGDRGLPSPESCDPFSK